MALTQKKKWGLGTAISGAVLIFVGVFAFQGGDSPIVGQIVSMIGLVLEGLGFRFVAPGNPPGEV
jgi:hypothetical protein